MCDHHRVSGGGAATLIVDVPNHVLRGLAVRAARHGRTVEAEVREVLTAAAAAEDSRDRGLVGTLRDRVHAAGGVDLPNIPRTPVRRVAGPWDDPDD